MRLKKNRSGVYVATFKSAAGKPQAVSTRCTDAQEARRVVKESGLEDLERAAKAGRLTQEAIGHITTGRKLTMEKALVEWDQWMGATGKTDKTRHNALTTMRAFIRERKLQKVPPVEVSEKDVDAFINNPHIHTKAQSRKVNLSMISSFFNCGSAKGWCMGNPARLVRVKYQELSLEEKEVLERKPFTAQELEKLTAYLRKEEEIFWLFAMKVNLETALRLGDICRLEWASFNTPGKLVVHLGKREKRLELPISQELSQMVTEIPVTSPEYLFPEERAIIMDTSRRSLPSKRFTRLCLACGIEGKSFHCLRHTAATDRYNALEKDKQALAAELAEALTVDQIRSLLGHVDAKTTKRYLH